ncbi:zinc carboxypeptidase [Antarcticibacterium flavum]|uniref:Zinc carboxypeptidase n=1 Tax=Antarcticibacterium flavum TaxID=2058175 RepID=A0A5B7X2F9_9FLAO|nr:MULTISPECIES: M14 family zinc carboxypeptidase [Antarcticibacterium]MCM4159822.1 zinc carboxypeptidase [Antarcticibacterium sp. W02-3]QCY68828.1 zinc carboxypeptidase [Antarcticibacterium flavum]
MKQFFLPLVFLMIIIFPAAAQQEYFFPGNKSLSEEIPSPQEFLGYEVGEFHTRHDRLVAYFEELARVSNRVHIQEIGKTYEQRSMIVATITSEQNYNNLETIRQEHLQLIKQEPSLPSLDGMPVIIQLGYNVHGNEPSSSEAAMLTAYYLTASNDLEVLRYLEEAVIFVEPVLNPDGRDRHTNWANMHRSFPPVADANDREHNEVWPSGRVNHYWFDLNRDWLPLVHVESKARIDFYHRWYPNVVTDFHEMGTNSTYFFEPTKPFGSENPIIPRSNYEGLNNLLAPYFAGAMDEIGSLYFTKEVFDNSYPGYGSTYPDIQGGLGLVFEQASSRGHLQESIHGDLSFAFTIRNHLVNSLATVKAAVENREVFLRHQKEFFESAITQAEDHPSRGYIFGDAGDSNRIRAFMDLLLRHKIEVYENNRDLIAGNRRFEAGRSYFVPGSQPQFRMVASIFDTVTQFQDSLFYDTSAWSMVHAYGLPSATLNKSQVRTFNRGSRIDSTFMEPGDLSVEKSNYAYIFSWEDYNAPAVLYKLQQKGILTRVAYKPFSIKTVNGEKEFSYGSIMVPVAIQELSPEELYQIMREVAVENRVPVEAVTGGFSTTGVDLGSRSFEALEKPQPLLIIGKGTSQYEAGEIWHMLDSKLKMPLTKVDILDFSRLDLDRYNELIMVQGNYNLLDEEDVQNIKAWVEKGNTLILQKSAVTWAINNKIIAEELEVKKDTATNGETTVRRDFETAEATEGAKIIGGSMYRVDLDITHPLGFGYKERELIVYKNNNTLLKPSKNPYSTVAVYKENPLVSGYVSRENLEKIPGTASTLVSKAGRGRVISFIDNPNFRGTWYGTNKLFFNALFFGQIIKVPNIAN